MKLQAMESIYPTFKWLPTLVDELQSSLHENHHFIFNLKKKLIAPIQIGNIQENEELKVVFRYLKDLLNVSLLSY